MLIEQVCFICLRPSLELSEKELECKKIGLNVATTPDAPPFVLIVLLSLVHASECACVSACACLYISERVRVCGGREDFRKRPYVGITVVVFMTRVLTTSRTQIPHVGMAGNTALVCRTVGTGVATRFHTLPSHQTLSLSELLGFS